MKKLLVFSFLFIFLGATTVFGELLKLPVLIHHYCEHTESEKEANLSFVDFLAEHYQTEEHHSDKHHDHEKLPFKTLDSHVAQIISLVPQSNYSISYHITPSSKLKKTFQYQDVYSNTHLDSIWQPPRFS